LVFVTLILTGSYSSSFIILGFGSFLDAGFFEDKKLLLSRSSSSSNNPFFCVDTAVGLVFGTGFDLVNVGSSSSSPVKRELFLLCTPDCKGCFAGGLGKLGVPSGPPRG
jgi:hypothetical protein